MPRIEKAKDVCGGDACIAATLVPVWALEQARRLCFTDAELLHNYPSLNQCDLMAAWEYVKSNQVEIDHAIRENEEA
jgi:uncharacterized protein (DUF433 family)